MGLIKSSAIITISSLLFLSLFIGNIFLTFNLSLEHSQLTNNLEKESIEIINNLDLSNTIKEDFVMMQKHCEHNENFYPSQKMELNIPCDKIKEGYNQTIEYVIEDIINNSYYKQYNCSLVKCIQNGQPLILVSATAKSFWQSKFYFTIISSIILSIILFLLLENKKSFPTTLGILILLSSLPLSKTNWFFNLFENSKIINLISIFFSKSHSVFLLMTIIGISLIFIGLAIKIFKAGFKISKFFENIFNKNKQKKTKEKEEKKYTQKEVDEMIKKEIEKVKKSK